MSLEQRPQGPSTELVTHLDLHIESSRRLLRILTEQTDAIQRRDVEGVLAGLADVQMELALHARLEHQRRALLRDAAGRLGIPCDGVELDELLLLVEPGHADAGRRKSAELTELVAELTRLQAENRVLIRQRLAFLDDLVRTPSGKRRLGHGTTDSSSAHPAGR